MRPRLSADNIRRRQVQFIHIPRAPHRIQQRIRNHPFLAHQIRRHLAVRQFLHTFNLFIQSQRRAVVAQVIHQRFHHFRVRKFQQPRPLLHDNHPHSQRREHARVFHANHSASHHDQRLRNLRHA